MIHVKSKFNNWPVQKNGSSNPQKTVPDVKKKKVVDPLSKKEWYQLRAPAPFQAESFGWTCANRTQGLSNLFLYLRKG